MMIGSFISMKGGLAGVLDWAHFLNVQLFEIYARNPRRSVPRRVSKAARDLFVKECEERNLQVYLSVPRRYNPASSSEATRSMTRKGLLEDLHWVNQIQAQGIIMRPGAYVQGGKSVGIGRACQNILRILEEQPDGKILLENSVGAGTEIGSQIEEIADLLHGLPEDRVGFCLNITNLHLAGYDILDDAVWLDLCEQIESYIGWKRVWLAHVSDTSAPQGSQREEICTIGEGYIGQRGLHALGIFEPWLFVPKIIIPPKLHMLTIKQNLMIARMCL